MAGTTTLHHFLVITAFARSASVTATASDGCGDVFTATPNSPKRGAGNSTWIFYAIVTEGGCSTMVVNFSGNTSGDVFAIEYSGMPVLSDPFDCDVGASGNSTSLASGSCTSRLGSESADATVNNGGEWSFMAASFKSNNSSQNVLIGAGGVLVGNGTFTAGSGFTIQGQNAHGTNPNSEMLEDQIMGVAPPVINPTSLVLNQGGTQAFTVTGSPPGTWSCPSCAGSVDPSGVYTAPATVTAQQSAGGNQFLPNNHIYNTRVDSLPLRSDSATLIAGSGTDPINYLPAMPVNYSNGSTPTESQVFFYTPENNGSYRIPAYPDARIEIGWLSARLYNPFNQDHHLIVIPTDNGLAQEMYQYYPAGTAIPVEGCADCTSQSGVKYAFNGYDLPLISINAAGTVLWPCTMRLQELEQALATGGTINHVNNMTLANSKLHNAHLWPATTSVNFGLGVNFYGERLRLKSSYNISGFSAPAQIILTQLKQYGVIVTDGGLPYQVSVEDTRWPKTWVDAFHEIGVANIVPSNFEVVDESGLMIDPLSGEANVGTEAVTFTRTSDGVSNRVPVVLTGVAVTLPKDVLYIQAGAPAQTFTAMVNIGSVTWTMSPSVGTLSAGGLYTPPASQVAPTSTLVTATSTTNAAVAASMTVVILPNGVIRMASGQAVSPGAGDYTDSQGNIWYAGPLTGGDAQTNFSSEAMFGYYNPGFTWPTSTDILLYKVPIYSGNDLRFDVWVANGTYPITLKLANNNSSDQGNFVIEVQGVAGSLFDVFDQVGGNMPLDTTVSAVVTDNHLSLVLRAANTTGNRVAPFISALQIGLGGQNPNLNSSGKIKIGGNVVVAK